ncbi:MAG: hypothetical protein CMF69_00220 [Magnetovibrio sp.]|nr:hypothetical protein [Magnetovibrio sp.]
MPYESIPGVGATYLDGAFQTVVTSDQPRILVLGTSSGGNSYNIFQINSVGDAEDEFGSDSELMKPVHEALEQGSDNIAVMRIGGKKGSFTLTDGNGGELKLVPEKQDDDVLTQLSLFLEVDGGELRISIFDQDREEWIYDSDEARVLDTGLVDVVNSDFDLMVTDLNTLTFPSDPLDPTNAPTLDVWADAANDPEDFMDDTAAASLDADVVIVGVAGEDGEDMCAMERYACLTNGYQFLDYEDADILIPAGTFVDTLNQASGAELSFADFNAGEPGLPVVGTEDDGLGFLWQYEYRGKPYTVFFEREDPYSNDASDYDTTVTNNGSDIIFEPHDDIGDLASIVRVRAEADANVTAGNETVTVSAIDGFIDVRVGFENAATTHTQFASALTVASVMGKLIFSDVDVSAGPATVLVAIDQQLTSTAGGDVANASVILDDLLTGEETPSGVLKRLLLGEDAEVRECHFGHQLATACMKASTTWSTMLGCISTSAPEAYSRPKVAEWVGQEPDYTVTGTDLSVPDAGAAGEGLLGIKFHSGAAGYRSKQIKTGGSGSEGYAYGGYILTKGAALPTDFPYGVSDDDEATDAKGKPVDIGKHLLVTASWPILSNGFDGGSEYRGSLCGTLAGKLTVTSEKEEPIGINGVLPGIRRPPRMRTPLINSLAKLRFISTRRETGLGHILVSVKTAAHPDSDYARLSTIRSVNREISGIRNICKPYIGKEFSSTRLASLQTAIDGFLRAEKEAGFNQGAVAQMAYTRQDKIMGRLTIKLKMIPPFSIEAITIETTLAAEESELTL